ncbi:mycothiol synthase [Streptacidiphilus neutrinimicus]|uniref:mycothiol synthase n=1 Tax=Streptacidiphilus neutrinimicus TaxID=105420 RepID=UPI000A82F896|nr:mycothiol synthase [Streptacidiphilus neutrinimicus]
MDTAEREEIAALLERAAEADGRQAVSEQGRLALRSGRADVNHLTSRDEHGVLLGYAQIDAEWTAELVIDPARRREGNGRGLLRRTLNSGARRVWAHGGHPGATRLAAEFGLELVRELRQLRRTGPAPEVPPLPDGVTVRTFDPGRDEEAWLKVNAAAFAHHPEQGSWTRRDIEEREAQAWFDPEGFFLAERGGELVGFHWTKVEGGLGEVYVVGVSPTEQGSGLGKALTAIGVHHLAQRRGLPTVMLYVDADNPAALRVYQKAGFTVHEVDLMFAVRG